MTEDTSANAKFYIHPNDLYKEINDLKKKLYCVERERDALKYVDDSRGPWASTAVQLVHCQMKREELEEKLEEIIRQRDEARTNYERLDGYRELADRASKAENERDLLINILKDIKKYD